MKTIVLCMVISILVIAVGIQIYDIVKINSLISFENAGFYLLRHYPTTIILGHALTEKFYSTVYTKDYTFYPERFADTLSTL